MKVIGITGGVGSGKSEVLRLLEEKFNCGVIRTDDVARSLCEPGEKSYEMIVKIHRNKYPFRPRKYRRIRVWKR